jgi:hypothetical protein
VDGCSAVLSGKGRVEVLSSKSLLIEEYKQSVF